MYEAYLATRRLELLALWRVPRRADRASSGRRGGVPAQCRERGVSL